MGYETNFDGNLVINPALKSEHLDFLTGFCNTRRMKRNEEIVSTYSDPTREAVNLPIGRDGGFYVGDRDNYGQSRTHDIIDYNSPPRDQHGLWCGWSPSDDGMYLTAQDGKNYNYTDWLKYLIENFFNPWGYKLNGSINWEGEDSGDVGIIKVTNNQVKTLVAEITFKEESD